MAEKLEMMSSNIIQENIDYIASKFPNALKEVMENGKLVKKIDFDILKQELSTILIDDRQERYQMTWPDKKKSILLANSRINATLRPIKEKSVDFDNTKNLYIEGDNLDVLKLLRETYLGKIKMIYIDPPYNTGNDFVYEDDFSQSSEDYLGRSGQYDEQGNRLFQNTESNGRFHTDWLNMMYPRLKIAKDFLADDGVIFMSIDDNEYANLKKITDEIFGEKNFITSMPRKTVEHIRVLADYEIQNLNDYVLVYCKDKNNVVFKKKIIGQKEYDFADKNGAYMLKPFQNSGQAGTRAARPNLYYPIYYNMKTQDFSLESNGESIEILPKKMMNQDGRWLWSREKFMKDKHLLCYHNNSIFRKEYFNEGEDQNNYQAEKNWLDNYQNRLGALSLRKLGLNGMFDYSKPVELINFFIDLINSIDYIVLDFFSGSSTTAQAVMEKNIEDGGKRRFIMVQLPESIDINSQAAKVGYKDICDIGQERIRRAGKKIKEEAGVLGQSLDIGFRVLKLDSSNMNDVYYNPNSITQDLLETTVDNIKVDRTPLDLLFQVMLELGIELSAKIEEKELNGKTYFVVNENDIVACFDNGIDDDLTKELAKIKPIYAVFKDSSFTTDSANINCEQIFKSISPSTTIKVI